jgi:hypothetical protein
MVCVKRSYEEVFPQNNLRKQNYHKFCTLLSYEFLWEHFKEFFCEYAPCCRLYKPAFNYKLFSILHFETEASTVRCFRSTTKSWPTNLD